MSNYLGGTIHLPSHDLLIGLVTSIQESRHYIDPRHCVQGWSQESGHYLDPIQFVQAPGLGPGKCIRRLLICLVSKVFRGLGDEQPDTVKHPT